MARAAGFGSGSKEGGSVRCSGCGAEVSALRDTCPRCGASTDRLFGEPRRPDPGGRTPEELSRNRKTVLWIAGGLLVLAVAMGNFRPFGRHVSFGPGAIRIDTRGEGPREPVTIGAAQLFEAYHADSRAAARRYGRREMVVTGDFVRTVPDGYGSIDMRLKTNHPEMPLGIDLDGHSVDAATRLQPGQAVTVSCRRVAGSGDDPWLSDCVIQPPTPVGAAPPRLPRRQRLHRRHHLLPRRHADPINLALMNWRAYARLAANSPRVCVKLHLSGGPMRRNQVRALSAVTLASAIALATPAFAASADYYLKLGGVEGDTKANSQDDKHKNQIEILSYSWGTARAADPLTDGVLIIRNSEQPAPGSAKVNKVNSIAIKQSTTTAAGGVQVAAGDVTGDGRADVSAPRDTATGQATGKRMHKPMMVRGSYDRSAPPAQGSLTVLINGSGRCVIGARYPSLELSGQGKSHTLRDATIADCDSGGTAAAPTESITFVYGGLG